MGIRELFGEIKRKDIIGVGDKVRVVTNNNKVNEGILRYAAKNEIKINGSIKLKTIKVVDAILKCEDRFPNSSIAVAKA